MKKILLISLFTIFVSFHPSFAKPVKPEKALKVANTFLKMEKLREQNKLTKVISKQIQKEVNLNKLNIGEIKEIRGDDGKVLAYVTELEPEGYIITSADDKIRPVIGYSFKGKFPFEESKQNVLLHLVQWDMEARTKVLRSRVPEVMGFVQSNTNSWDTYTSNEELPQVTASTSTQWGPWITTNWYQSGYYNDYCPDDPLYSSGYKCPVGCVATAAAQIINYWAYPSSVSFEDKSWLLGGDAYTSIAWNSYKKRFSIIDIDGTHHNTYGYASFNDLNTQLSTINYDGDTTEIAYLCFAAGIKHRMGYSSSGSGAHLKASAYTKGFDYGSAHWKLSNWNMIIMSKAIENIKMGWPIQLGISKYLVLDGHSVVVDGYKETGEFHLNLGWGGEGDSWYFLPIVDTREAPDPGDYYFNTVTEVVYDICPYQGWNQWGADEKNSFSTIYTYPTEEPNIKWEVTSPFSSYTFDYAVVGTGNKVYAALSPCDLGQGNHPYICVIDAYGDKSKMKNISINDSDYDIDYLTQNHKGEVFFGTSEYLTKTTIYRVDPKTENVTSILDHTSPDRGIFDQPIKVDGDDYLYFIIEPTSTSNGTKFYSINRTGYVRWSHTFTSGMKFVRSISAIDEERNQVYLNYYDDSLDKSYLVCFDRTFGTVKWTYPFPGTHAEWEMAGAPAVSEDGTIYVGCYTTLYAINPSGTKIYEQSFDPAYTHKTPAIGQDGTLYVNYGRLISSIWRPGWVWALNPDLTFKWSSPVDIGLGSSDSMDDIYSAGNEMVGFTYTQSGTGYIGGVRDNGTSGSILWTSNRGTGKMIFGPGQTIYTVESTCTGTSSIHALSIGDRGDEDGLGMAYTDNSSPNMPSNPYPADETNDIDLTVTLSWSCSDPEAHTLKYSLFVGESGYDMVPVDTNITSTSYELSGLKPGTGYAWKIIATDGQAPSEGPTWVFATDSHVTWSFDPNTYIPESPVEVCIEVTPESTINVYAVEDAPPTDWTVSNISGGGTWDDVNKKVKWGPFFDSDIRTLCYWATPPSGETGEKTFSGTASFDGSDEPFVRTITHYSTTMADLIRFVDRWLWTGIPGSIDEDIAPPPNGDGKVDFLDFSYFAQYWYWLEGVQ